MVSPLAYVPLTRVSAKDVNELDRMSHELHEAEETRDQMIAYLQQREVDLANQLSQTEAELRAAMDGLRTGVATKLRRSRPSEPDASYASLMDTEMAYPIPAHETKRLEQRRWVLKHAKPRGVDLEVGVFRGSFSEVICREASPKTLILVDGWTLTGDTFGWDDAYTCFGTLPTKVARDETERRMQKFPDTQAVLIEGWFSACVDQIPEPLDWAYLDAGHQYDSTLYELKALDRLVKPDRTILGDDWNPDPENKHHGVYRAVIDFVTTHDWNLICAGPGLQWAIRRVG